MPSNIVGVNQLGGWHRLKQGFSTLIESLMTDLGL